MPPTPGPPVVDESYVREKKRLARYKSMPRNQFQSQASRERERLFHQITEERFGRRQTLPWDDSSDLRANSENNVRSRWVEQGIWGDEWGPAWPRDSHPMTTKWETRGDGPFFGSYAMTTSECMPGARWGHEEYDPESESESEPESESVQEQRPTSDIFRLGVREPERPKSPWYAKYLRKGPGPIPPYAIPRPTVRNPAASHPYDQFLYQVSKERVWIRDELLHTRPGTVFDLDAMAYQSVKDNWIKDKIWNPKWSELPGMTWIHEEPVEEETVKSPTASAATVGRPQDAINDSQPYDYPRYNIFGLAPAANSRTNSSSVSAPHDAEACDAERRTSERGRATQQAASPQPPRTYKAPKLLPDGPFD